MATGTTTNYSLPFPLSTDPVNVAGDIQQLADKIDDDLQEIIEDTSSLMWTTGGTFSNGLQAPTYNDSTGKMSMSLSQDLQTSASPSFVGVTLTGDIAVNGGDITTTAGTFNLINTNATTLNIGGAATVLNVGASAGQTNILGDLNLATGKVLEINDVTILSATGLGSSVVSSSLTSVGTITTGVWNAGSVTSSGAVQGTTLASTIATGTSPITVTSTTLVSNLNADLLDGQEGSYYLSLANATGTLAATNGGTGVNNGSSTITLGGNLVTSGAYAITLTATGTTNVTLPTTGTLVTTGDLSSYAPINNPTFTGTVASNGTLIKMNADATSGTDDVYFTVERGSDPDVSLRWNESTDAWEFTNDGTTYQGIGSGSGGGGVSLEAVLMFAGM